MTSFSINITWRGMEFIVKGNDDGATDEPPSHEFDITEVWIIGIDDKQLQIPDPGDEEFYTIVRECLEWIDTEWRYQAKRHNVAWQ